MLKSTLVKGFYYGFLRRGNCIKKRAKQNMFFYTDEYNTEYCLVYLWRIGDGTEDCAQKWLNSTDKIKLIDRKQAYKGFD